MDCSDLFELRSPWNLCRCPRYLDFKYGVAIRRSSAASDLSTPGIEKAVIGRSESIDDSVVIAVFVDIVVMITSRQCNNGTHVMRVRCETMATDSNY